jgi:hypothetical protein
MLQRATESLGVRASYVGYRARLDTAATRSRLASTSLCRRCRRLRLGDGPHTSQCQRSSQLRIPSVRLLPWHVRVMRQRGALTSTADTEVASAGTAVGVWLVLMAACSLDLRSACALSALGLLRLRRPPSPPLHTDERATASWQVSNVSTSNLRSTKRITLTGDTLRALSPPLKPVIDSWLVP